VHPIHLVAWLYAVAVVAPVLELHEQHAIDPLLLSPTVFAPQSGPEKSGISYTIPE
jgi:hypothetical protein